MKKAYPGALLLVALAGVWVSVLLVGTHIDVAAGGAASGLCDMGEGVNCLAAAQSAWSSVLGIPIAVLGLAFYAATILAVVWCLVRGEPRKQPAASLLQVGWTASVVYSLILGVVSVTALDAICPFCAVLYGLNILGLIALSLWLGQGPHRPLVSVGEWAPSLPRDVVALAFVGAFVVATLAGTLYARSTIAEIESQRAAFRASQAPVTTQTELVGPDTPVRGATSPTLVLVEFSNFQCPWCARFAESVAAVADEFGEDLQVGFRHFPGPRHEFARPAALAAVCAHRQERFHAMKERLFAASPQLDAPAIERMARDTGLDMDVWRSCLADPEAMAVVDADLEAGRLAGVQGTPTFFLNGQRHEGFQDADALRTLLRSELRRLRATTP